MSLKVGDSAGGDFEPANDAAGNGKASRKKTQNKDKENLKSKTGELAKCKLTDASAKESTRKPGTPFKASEKLPSKTERKELPIQEIFDNVSDKSVATLRNLLGSALSYETGLPVNKPKELNPEALKNYENKVQNLSVELYKIFVESGCEKLLPPPEKRTKADYDNLKFQMYEMLAAQITRLPAFKAIGLVEFDSAKGKFNKIASSNPPFYENLTNYTLVKAIDSAVNNLGTGTSPEKLKLKTGTFSETSHPGWKNIQFNAFLPGNVDITRPGVGRFSERFFG